MFRTIPTPTPGTTRTPHKPRNPDSARRWRFPDTQRVPKCSGPAKAGRPSPIPSSNLISRVARILTTPKEISAKVADSEKPFSKNANSRRNRNEIFNRFGKLGLLQRFPKGSRISARGCPIQRALPRVSIRPTPSLSRVAPHSGDPKGVEDISPGLPDSERATPGANPFNPSISRAARRAKRVSPDPRPNCPSNHGANFANTTPHEGLNHRHLRLRWQRLGP